MANRLLRSIAVSMGAGLAIGFGRTLQSRRSRPPATTLHPILTRLEEIEGRVARVEFTPSAPAMRAPEEIEALGTLVSSQSEDIALLREDILRIERRNAEQAEAFGEKVALLEQQVPANIQAGISLRMTELEQKLRGEFQDIHHRTVDAFADTIERRVVGRITALENSLIEQSQSIASLREKSLKTDENLQRLLDAVEKLCSRAEAQAQAFALQAQRSAPMPASIHAARTSVETTREPKPQTAVHPERPLVRDIEPEPELVFAAAESRSQSDRYSRPPKSTPPRSGPPQRGVLRPAGMAILGLAILGFRFIR